MIQFTDEMVRLINNARDDGYPCIIATASNDGTPNAGYIGTVLAVYEIACNKRLLPTLPGTTATLAS